MASGRLGRSLISTANTNTLVYTVPSGVYSVLNICLVNTSGSATQVRVAVSNQSGTTPIASEYIEYSAPIPPINGVLERTGIVCTAGEKIIIWANTANAISVRINGYEESVS